MHHSIPTASTPANSFQQLWSPTIIQEKPLRSWKTSAQVKVQRDLADRPLLRTYDYISGSQPDELGHMYARASNMSLTTSQTRRSTLQTHLLNYRWVPTPYISFTSSPEALRNLANFRKRRPYRQDQTIIAIDPAVRLEAKRPVINYGDEMRYYNINDPYDLSQEELNSHYICLWRVRADEVVESWSWDELSSNPNWYQDIVLPRFREFREKRWRGQQERTEGQIQDLSSALDALRLQKPPAES